MKEKEFKKRIKTRGRPSILYFEGDKWVLVSSVDKTIDEAKKEFPPILQNRRGEPWVNPEKAAIWFLKHFGDKNE